MGRTPTTQQRSLRTSPPSILDISRHHRQHELDRSEPGCWQGFKMVSGWRYTSAQEGPEIDQTPSNPSLATTRSRPDTVGWTLQRTPSDPAQALERRNTLGYRSF